MAHPSHGTPPGFITPCLPTSAARPPAGPWLHEIKHDGFRIIGRKDGKRVRLYSRPGNDLAHRFPLIFEALARLASRSRSTLRNTTMGSSVRTSLSSVEHAAMTPIAILFRQVMRPDALDGEQAPSGQLANRSAFAKRAAGESPPRRASSALVTPPQNGRHSLRMEAL